MKNIITITVFFFISLVSFSQKKEGIDGSTKKGGKLPSQIKKEKTPIFNGDKKTTTYLKDPFAKPKETSFYQEDKLVKVSKEAKKVVQKANDNLEAELEKKAAGLAHKTEQYLGDVRVKGGLVNIECRDHSAVDGDRVRVILNGAVIANNIYLTGGYKGISVDLKKGKNEINFIALNEGDYSPNTAQFKVYDNKDKLVTMKEWALYAGAKATIIVYNE